MALINTRYFPRVERAFSMGYHPLAPPRARALGVSAMWPVISRRPAAVPISGDEIYQASTVATTSVGAPVARSIHDRPGGRVTAYSGPAMATYALGSHYLR